MSIVLQGSTSGSITIQEPAIAGSNTINLPARTGTMALDGPAFSATLTNNQTLTTAVLAKVQFSNETFDTNNNYDTSLFRFTPTVAGYYLTICQVRDSTGVTGGQVVAYIYKNGAVYSQTNSTNTAQGLSSINTALIFMNGTTDYLEGYAQQNSGGNMVLASANTTMNYFSSVLVRAA